ncbi:unnamed protein product [Victoria cruziana]
MEPRLLLYRLRTCANLRQAKQVHCFLVSSGGQENFGGAMVLKMVDMGFTEYAQQVFDEIRQPNVFVSNSLLSALSRSGLDEKAVRCFFSIHRNDHLLNSFSFSPVLKACAAIPEFHAGRQIHALIIRMGFGSNVVVRTGLVDFYGKLRDMDSAECAFNEILWKDVVSYNALISGFSKNGRTEDARRIFDEMRERNVVTWNAMISGYMHNGQHMEGMAMFERMCVEGVEPTEVTLVTALSIAAKLGALEKGQRIKNYIDEIGFKMSMILSTAVMEMYVKCGSVGEARKIFDAVPERDVVAWTTMIAGYTQNGQFDEAITLFGQMKEEKVKPNEVTLVSVLSACAHSGSADVGDRLGTYLESEDMISSVFVGSALVDMYAKTGKILKARQAFDRIAHRDIVSWNAMIGGLAMHGLFTDVVELFGQMRELAIEPNDVTFVGLLAACVHAGLLEMGCRIYDFMQTDFEVIPQIEHCACIVDLFCRAGLVRDAYSFIRKMVLEPNAVIWGTLLSACRICNDVELAECAAKELMILEPHNSGNYVLLSNIYANAGRWDDAVGVRALMKEKGVQKNPAYSWIEIENVVHKFLVGDTSHPQSDEICCALEGLGLAIEESNKYASF